MEQPVKIKVLCISMGGPRADSIRAQLNHPSFELVFSPGVPSRSLSTKKGLLNACYAAGILMEDPALTTLAEPPASSSQRGQWDDMDYPSELWKKGKHLARDRAVLACLLAHLTAMPAAVEMRADIIIEDNVRTLRDLPALAEQIRSFQAASSGADVRYFGYVPSGRGPERSEREDYMVSMLLLLLALLFCARQKRAERFSCANPVPLFCARFTRRYLGPRDNLTYLYSTHLPAHAVDGAAPFPYRGEHFNDDTPGISGAALWGAFAYMVTARGHELVRDRLREDIGYVRPNA
jgi:hypothetical protein